MSTKINLPPPTRVAIGTAMINGKPVEIFLTPEWARYFQTLNTTVENTTVVVFSGDADGAHVGLLDENDSTGDQGMIAIPGPKGDKGDTGPAIFMLQEPEDNDVFWPIKNT